MAIFGVPTLEDLGPVAGKNVLVRVDFNVPSKDGVITDDLRIRAALPTLEWLTSRGAKVTCCTHLGRPKGAPDPAFSVEPVRARLAELASPGKAITSAETARRLGPEWRSVIHTLPPRVIRGLSKPADLCEVMCEAVGELTVVQNDHFLLETEPELRLYMDSKSVVLNSTRPSARIGGRRVNPAFRRCTH